MSGARPELTRDEKVENLVLNFSLIMMGIFEGAFASLVAGMAGALEKTADAMTEALDGSSKGRPRKKRNSPGTNAESEVNAKLKGVFAGLRKEVAEGFSNKDESFRKFIADPAFDAGVQIVERHPVSLPKLTESLSDTDLAGYAALIQNEDARVAEMMKELGDWQKTTPRFRQ